jgi:hypothetical protein
MVLGHDECQFDTVPTTESDRDSFVEGEDWAGVDPIIDEFLDKK